jgi:uncharacterized protein (DUF952 family)
MDYYRRLARRLHGPVAVVYACAGAGEQAGMGIVYKITPEEAWREAERAGAFAGAPVDLADGYIHLSTPAQVRETAARHFAEARDLLLVAVDEERLGPALRYEPSRGGALFPHLYGPLPLDAVASVEPLPLGPDGRHAFPGGVP